MGKWPHWGGRGTEKDACASLVFYAYKSRDSHLRRLCEESGCLGLYADFARDASMHTCRWQPCDSLRWLTRAVCVVLAILGRLSASRILDWTPTGASLKLQLTDIRLIGSSRRKLCFALKAATKMTLNLQESG